MSSEISTAPREEQLLERLEEAADRCAELERHFDTHPPPEIEFLIKLHRAKVLKLSLQPTSPVMVKLITDLMKPILDWARLEEKRKDRELAERKYHDQSDARKTAEAEAAGENALSPETLARIERELNLL